MKITIAGAGAGKTTEMANKIINKYKSLQTNKNIYCIAFTNNAVDCIEKKLTSYFGNIPSNIKLSTIHSFLYQDLIRPYYYLLYEKHFEKISNIKLDDNIKYKNYKISELEKNDILHVEKFSEKAKWIVYRKSGDKKREKEIRKIILKSFAQYCDCIFIDEAQDIDNNMLEVVKALDNESISIELIGDTKQDLKGYGSLLKLSYEFQDKTEYLNICHRCPEKHLIVSNSIVPYNEKQQTSKRNGDFKFIYENDVDIVKLIEESKFDLKFISQKNNRFSTGNKLTIESKKETLLYEIKCALIENRKNTNEIDIKKEAFSLTQKSLALLYKNLNEKEIMNEVFKDVKLNRTTYARVISALKLNYKKEDDLVVVSSIDSIKGRGEKNCLFILTSDLAPYLFLEKMENNKTKNKLYVALTRSEENLTIIISKEVEHKYGREHINKIIDGYHV